MSTLFIATFLLLNMVLMSPNASAQAEPPANGSTADTTAPAKPSTTFLQGGVRHKEYVDPVQPGLMAGAKFDEQTLTKLTPNNEWIPIPAWMAGTWQFKTENVTEMQNFTKHNYTPAPYTIRNESTKILGEQTDKTRQVWHF